MEWEKVGNSYLLTVHDGQSNLTCFNTFRVDQDAPPRELVKRRFGRKEK